MFVDPRVRQSLITLPLIPSLSLSTFLSLVLSTILSSTSSYAASSQQPTIAIIIDDMGNHYNKGETLIKLPYPLTLAFLPGRKHTQALTQLANQHKKEIMLHAPMENSLGIELGAGGLTSTMNEQEIKHRLLQSLRSIPFAVGVNNHMGSKLTSNPQAMQWVMEALSGLPFYFVDSRTSGKSVAAKTALSHDIPTLKRDIFLDHEQSRKFVQKQFLKLIEVARKKGTAIAIGHPHKVTIDYLSWALPRLDEKGVRIATISSLWHLQHPSQKMFPNFQVQESLAASNTETPVSHP